MPGTDTLTPGATREYRYTNFFEYRGKTQDEALGELRKKFHVDIEKYMGKEKQGDTAVDAWNLIVERNSKTKKEEEETRKKEEKERKKSKKSTQGKSSRISFSSLFRKSRSTRQ